MFQCSIADSRSLFAVSCAALLALTLGCSSAVDSAATDPGGHAGAPDNGTSSDDGASAGAPSSADGNGADAGAVDNGSGSGTGAGAVDNGASGSGATASAKFFLPTLEPDNTGAAVVLIDGSGATHAVYPSYAGGGAYYAYCGSGCTGAGTTDVVRFETPDGTTTNALLALTTDGHPRVLLSAFEQVYYASCDAHCGERASWTIAAILDKTSDRDVTGAAFALDAQDRPRFLLHTHVAYLGIGQKDPATYWLACDDDCTSAAHWKMSQISSHIWQGSTLRFDAAGNARVATSTEATLDGNESDQIVYFECAGSCDEAASWNGIALGASLDSESDIVSIHPAASLALTKAGAPRIAFLTRSDAGARGLAYFECDGECTGDHWSAALVSSNQKLGSGASLALDAHDRPRIAYTLDYDIALASCDGNCTNATAGATSWTPSKVEGSAELPADQIFLNYNCTVGAWLFHDPSLALGADGRAHVGYQAMDASAAGSTNDPSQPSCVAGTDMTWTRLALL